MTEKEAETQGYIRTLKLRVNVRPIYIVEFGERYKHGVGEILQQCWEHNDKVAIWIDVPIVQDK